MELDLEVSDNGPLSSYFEPADKLYLRTLLREERFLTRLCEAFYVYKEQDRCTFGPLCVSKNCNTLR